MKYKIIHSTKSASRYDGLLICMLADRKPARATASMLGKLGLNPAGLEKDGFTGGRSQDRSLSVLVKGESQKVILLGLGKAGDVDAARLRRRLQRAGAMLRAQKILRPLVLLPAGLSLKPDQVVEGCTIGLHLGAGARVSYARKGKSSTKPPTMVQIVLPSQKQKVGAAVVRNAATMGDIIVEARGWVSEPANKLGPSDLARRAVALGKKHGVKSETWTMARIRKERMGMLEQVGIGASREPRFVKMVWDPKKKSAPHVVIVGKGIVFDTGGLSLKPVKSMPAMKNDMAGAAVAAGVVAAAAARKLPVKVTTLLPIAENTPSSTSYRPGDVISGRSPKTVEIITTDAEGRLVMADALVLGAEMKPDAMIDVATLTGACLVALGSFTAGLWSNDDELAKEISKAAEQTGESVWHMPMLEEIRPFLRSDVADLRNTQADPYGGAIGAALFLREFVGTTTWAHLDIAGPAFNDKRTDVGPRGATGFGITTLVRYIGNLASR